MSPERGRVGGGGVENSYGRGKGTEGSGRKKEDQIKGGSEGRNRGNAEEGGKGTQGTWKGKGGTE